MGPWISGRLVRLSEQNRTRWAAKIPQQCGMGTFWRVDVSYFFWLLHVEEHGGSWNNPQVPLWNICRCFSI